MADGLWVLNDDGTFELQEPYKSELEEARLLATKAWTETLVGFLAERSPYSEQELVDELLRRNREREDGKVVVFEEFVLEALSGDL